METMVGWRLMTAQDRLVSVDFMTALYTLLSVANDGPDWESNQFRDEKLASRPVSSSQGKLRPWRCLYHRYPQ
jgi:hypothetical protein